MDKTDSPKTGTTPPDPPTAADDGTLREAKQYWGYLIKSDKCGTDKFDRLLRGIANVISSKFHPYDSKDLTPPQLAAFYRSVGGDYDVLFIDTPPSSISFIYRALGAFHSLQPTPDDEGYSAPSIPALKAKGFVTWQTIQLLLGPEQHVPFLQKAVELFDVKDPETGDVFPKILPKDCFPDRPDDAMERWYQSVAERLRREAELEAAAKPDATRIRVEVDDPQPRSSSETSGDERHGAASYFADPLYRNRHRPGYMRHVSKGSLYREDREDRDTVMGRVRHVLNFNPFHKERRRHSPTSYSPNKYSDDEDLDVDATPIATVPPLHPGTQHHVYPTASTSRKRAHPPRRESSLQETDSESDSGRPPSRHRSPVLNHRRSYESPAGARDYFPPYYEDRDRHHQRRYSSHDRTSSPRHAMSPTRDRPPPPVPVSAYGPTQTPLFATHVAKLQAQNYVYDRRPPSTASRPAAMPGRSSYGPSGVGVRYTSVPSSAADPDPLYMRERDRERDRDRDRDRDGYHSNSSSSRHRDRPHRRRSDEHPYERDRDGSSPARTARSHDRDRDDRDKRNLSGDRDPRLRARYVSSSGSLQDGATGAAGVGVGGRRYPEQPWR